MKMKKLYITPEMILQTISAMQIMSVSFDNTPMDYISGE